jgi:anhydro-N-acetylmuramic acid kinase
VKGRVGARSLTVAARKGLGLSRDRKGAVSVARFMRVAGIMSGTSLDGIDVAIAEIARGKIDPLAFRGFPYPKPVQERLLAVSSTTAHTAEIARLNFLLGELYAEALIATCRRFRLPLDSISLIGLHGQTIFHDGAGVDYLGRHIASTMQIGEAAVVAERTGIQVISNFRERDIAAGGHGAPLVPVVDYLLFRHARMARIAVNLGGIANVTVLPPGAKLEDVVAFDTGPGNMAIDALVRHMSGGRDAYDRNGRIAQSGKIHDGALRSLQRHAYFQRRPPKTAGREQFGAEFVDRLIAMGVDMPDLIATATELTAWSVAHGIFAAAPAAKGEAIVSGGGVHNRFLMRRLENHLRGWKIRSSAEFGIDPDAKEAIAFAALAYRNVRRRPSNVPSATGARHPVVLGKSTMP